MMIEDIFNVHDYDMITAYFTKRNNDLQQTIKNDGNIVANALNQCRSDANQAIELAKTERRLYEQRKMQLRKEAENLTKVYQSTVAPFQMLMSQGL